MSLIVALILLIFIFVLRKIKIIGITGSIGSGKSTSAKYLSKIGHVIDFDNIVKTIYYSGVVNLKILKLFGQSVFNKNIINRRAISNIVFITDKPKLTELHKILKWHIIDNALISAIIAILFGQWTIILDCPLLFESHLYKICHKIVLISSSTNNKIKRIIQRDNRPIEIIEQIMKLQMSDINRQKLKPNCIIINNDSSLTNLYKSLDNISF